MLAPSVQMMLLVSTLWPFVRAGAARPVVSWCGMPQPPTETSAPASEVMGAGAARGGYGGLGFDSSGASPKLLWVSPGRTPYTDEPAGEALLAWDHTGLRSKLVHAGATHLHVEVHQAYRTFRELHLHGESSTPLYQISISLDEFDAREQKTAPGAPHLVAPLDLASDYKAN